MTALPAIKPTIPSEDEPETARPIGCIAAQIVRQVAEARAKAKEPKK